MLKKITPDQICFGLNSELDVASISCYLQLLGREEMAETLSSRLTSEEIDEILSLFTRLMKKHLAENEYHRIFLHR